MLPEPICDTIATSAMPLWFSIAFAVLEDVGAVGGAVLIDRRGLHGAVLVDIGFVHAAHGLDAGVVFRALLHHRGRLHITLLIDLGARVECVGLIDSRVVDVALLIDRGLVARAAFLPELNRSYNPLVTDKCRFVC